MSHSALIMADIDDRARLKMMSVKELLAEAKARGIPTKDLLEKSEIIDALAAASASAHHTGDTSPSSSSSLPGTGASAQSAFISPPPPAMSESMPVQIEFEHSWLRALSVSWDHKLDHECRQVLTSFGPLSFWQERLELYKLACEAKLRPNARNYKGERHYNAFFADLTAHAGPVCV